MVGGLSMNFLPIKSGLLKQKMQGTMTVDSLKVAILAALHIADEFHQLKLQSEQIDAQLAARSAECADMLDRVIRPREAVAQE